MRPSLTVLSAAALVALSAVGVVGLPTADSSEVTHQKRQGNAAGFLSATFLGDVPHVFLHYSKADAPVTFTAVGGSQGELIPTGGTGGARDPYIFQNRVNGKVSPLITPCLRV